MFGKNKKQEVVLINNKKIYAKIVYKKRIFEKFIKYKYQKLILGHRNISIYFGNFNFEIIYKKI